VKGRSSRRAALALIAVGSVAAGCGGGDRQDKNEPSGTFNVDVVSATFPKQQRLAKQEQLVVEVRNTGEHSVPNVAVTINPGFSSRDDRQDLADPNRPIWIIDRGPQGGTTAYTDTWALGSLGPGKTARFVWHVTAVRTGSYDVHYRVAAGLNGKAKAAGPGGNSPEGVINVNVSGKPAQATVDPATGEVVRDDSGQ
jgi:hypothetical protein